MGGAYLAAVRNTAPLPPENATKTRCLSVCAEGQEFGLAQSSCKQARFAIEQGTRFEFLRPGVRSVSEESERLANANKAICQGRSKVDPLAPVEN
jgi:predicted lipoprotein